MTIYKWEGTLALLLFFTALLLPKRLILFNNNYKILLKQYHSEFLTLLILFIESYIIMKYLKRTPVYKLTDSSVCLNKKLVYFL